MEKLTITMERRDDGGLRVYSDDLRGLVLSHRDPILVAVDTIRALPVLIAGRAALAKEQSE